MIDIPDSALPKNNNGEYMCPRCTLTFDLCTCPQYDPMKPKMDQYTPLVLIDKKGRKGKTVTLIVNLPENMSYLKELTSFIKTKTGSGGTCYLKNGLGVIEIQGEKKAMIQLLLKNESL